ncbi:MAG: type II toxin-antitoxin system HicA family toxin [Bryobacteraceae bacterium]
MPSWFKRNTARDVSGAEALQALERLGFSITRQAGSHVRMVRGNRRVTVPMHRDLVVGTLQSILRQAGISVEEFVEAL